jgi:hypothetical protein
LRERVGIDQWMKISVKSILFFLCIERRKKKKKRKEGKGKRKRKGREYLEKNLRFYFEEDRIQRRWYMLSDLPATSATSQRAFGELFATSSRRVTKSGEHQRPFATVTLHFATCSRQAGDRDETVTLRHQLLIFSLLNAN